METEFTTTEGMKLFLKPSARRIAASNGWTPEEILDTFNNPKAIYPVKNERYAGQYRIAGTKIVIVGYPDVENKVFRGITLIVNGSKAPINTNTKD